MTLFENENGMPPYKVGSKFVEESTPKFSAPKQEIKPKHPEPCRLGGIHGYRVVTLKTHQKTQKKRGKVSTFVIFVTLQRKSQKIWAKSYIL